jgi:hypothetical protein
MSPRDGEDTAPTDAEVLGLAGMAQGGQLRGLEADTEPDDVEVRRLVARRVPARGVPWGLALVPVALACAAWFAIQAGDVEAIPVAGPAAVAEVWHVSGDAPVVPIRGVSVRGEGSFTVADGVLVPAGVLTIAVARPGEPLVIAIAGVRVTVEAGVVSVRGDTVELQHGDALVGPETGPPTPWAVAPVVTPRSAEPAPARPRRADPSVIAYNLLLDQLDAGAAPEDAYDGLDGYVAAWPRSPFAVEAHEQAARIAREQLQDCVRALPHDRAVAAATTGRRHARATAWVALCAQSTGELDVARAAFGELDGGALDPWLAARVAAARSRLP